MTDVAARERNPQVLRIAGFLKRSTVNGPGVRSVVWAQGCPLRCLGCFNPHLWDARGGKKISISHLAETICSTRGIDGATFSGGEPFFQADALAKLAAILHSNDLSVLTFTGYTFECLTRSKERSWQRLLKETDLLVAGPFHGGNHLHRTSPGPTDKEIFCLTDRIHPWNLTIEPGTVSIEYTITPAGTVLISGFPVTPLRERFHMLGTTGGG